MELNKKLRELRLARNLTQENVAEYLKVSSQTVSKWERGLLSPDITLLPKIALLFHCSIDTLFDMETVYLYTRKCLYGLVVSFLDKLPRKLCLKDDALPSGKWGKATFFSTPNVCNAIKQELKNEINAEFFDCFLTSPFSLEVVRKGVNKGAAVQKLADILNVDFQKIGAIGDYYNDEAMLRSVAHPVCCGQAPDDLKSLCEYITCHCNDGAVNDFINYIEKNYIKRR